LKNKRVDALNIKSGPTESGIESVSGEVLVVDKLVVFISQFWPILILLIPFGFLLYKKSDTVLLRLLKLLRLT